MEIEIYDRLRRDSDDVDIYCKIPRTIQKLENGPKTVEKSVYNQDMTEWGAHFFCDTLYQLSDLF